MNRTRVALEPKFGLGMFLLHGKPSSAGSWRRITARQHGISLIVRIPHRLQVHGSEFRARVEFRGLQDQGSTDVIAVSQTESIPRFAQLVADRIRRARRRVVSLCPGSPGVLPQSWRTFAYHGPTSSCEEIEGLRLQACFARRAKGVYGKGVDGSAIHKSVITKLCHASVTMVIM